MRIEQLIEQELGKKETEVQYERERFSDVLFGKGTRRRDCEHGTVKQKSWEIEQCDAVIVGGGPAGLAAAVRLYENGITDILILEREKQLGGILRQCIHDGFGLTRFKTTLSGPEYAQKFIDQVNELEDPLSY